MGSAASTPTRGDDEGDQWETLDATDELLAEHGGPFFVGGFSAADVAWAPFLERYAAQLPCLHKVRPRPIPPPCVLPRLLPLLDLALTSP